MLSRNRVKVLVIDDEPSICKALMMALTRAGYDAEFSVTGGGGLDIVRSTHVDVLLLDLRIPDMRGDVVFNVAAALQPQLRTQTLFMTGDITDKGWDLIAHCGCNFLRKPFDLRDMLDAVAALSPQVNDATA